MPRVMNLQLSSATLAIRVVLGIVLAGITFLIFYYLPANLASLISSHISSTNAETVSGMTSSIIGSTLPIIGLVLTVLVFLRVVLMGTNIDGVILILSGVFFAAFTYTALHGGTIAIALPSGLSQGATGNITIDVSLLMLVLLIPSLLTIVKGALVLAVRSSPSSQDSSA